jgi:hypothetical protein
MLPVGVDISLLLLAGLPSLPGLSRLLALALLASLAMLATRLLIFLHIFCHVDSSIFAERVLPRRCGFLLEFVT